MTALLAQATELPSVLYQYGAIGIALIGTGYAVRVLFQREIKAHDADRQRADRMEEEVKRLNTMIQDRILPTLSEATKIISDALYESRRGGGRP